MIRKRTKISEIFIDPESGFWDTWFVMNKDELKMLVGGITAAAEALDLTFEEVMEALEDGQALNCKQLDQLLDYRETL